MFADNAGIRRRIVEAESPDRAPASTLEMLKMSHAGCEFLKRRDFIESL